MASSSKATVKMQEFGDPSRFLTEEEHHHYRALTTFLGMTNTVDDPSESERPMNDYKSRKDRSALTYRYLADFTDLLPRHFEVVAVSPVTRKGVIRAIETDMGEDDDQQYVFTNNPEEKEGDKAGGPSHVGCAALFAEVPRVDAVTITSPGILLPYIL